VLDQVTFLGTAVTDATIPAPFGLDISDIANPVLKFDSSVEGEMDAGVRTIVFTYSDTLVTSATYDHVILVRVMPLTNQNLTDGFIGNSSECFLHPYPIGFRAI